MPLWLRYFHRYVLTVCALVFGTFVLALPVIVVNLFTTADRLGVWIQRSWSWLIAKAMGLTFSVSGQEHLVDGTSYIITPNHQSNSDILALVQTLPLRFRWVVKKELLGIPFFGWTLSRIGSVSLDRSNREQSVQRLQQASDKLCQGWSMLIYPEGTRSPSGELLPFKKGAFMMAVQTGMPILPVTSNGASKVLPKKTLRLRPGHITVTIGAPIPTEGLTEADVPELMERTRQAIRGNLDLSYDPFQREETQA